MKESKERAGQKREEMWVKLSGWEWWVVGLGGGTCGPQKFWLTLFFIFLFLLNSRDVTTMVNTLLFVMNFVMRDHVNGLRWVVLKEFSGKEFFQCDEISKFLGQIVIHFCSQSFLPFITPSSWLRLNLVLCSFRLLGDQMKRKCSSLLPSPASNHHQALFLIHCWPSIIIWVIIKYFLWELNLNRF